MSLAGMIVILQFFSQ